MRDVAITCSLVTFLSIEECHLIKQVNEHGKAVITGYIKSKAETELLKCGDADRYASIGIMDEKEESQSIFTGIVESISVQSEGDVKKATLTLTGATRLLDMKERTRTFQKEATTYTELLKTIGSNYSNIMYIMGEEKNAAINEFLVQYKETDWEFIKRLASHHGSCIIPFYQMEGIRFYMGEFVYAKEVSVDPISYTVQNATDEYFVKKRNGVSGLSKEDACYYCFESREFYDLGTKIQFQNKTCYIYQVESKLVGSELLHYYQVKSEGGFKQQKRFNTNIIGASLPATIASVSGSKVKISITADGTTDSPAKSFPFSTVYSSPDGSGWYCMPEQGDKVRLYFPNEYEKDAYVISAIHMEQEGNSSGGGTTSTGTKNAGTGGGKAASEPPRSNPDNKSITNKFNKKIELTPTTIVVTNNNGMSITLDDEEGIHIESNKDIVIESQENLEIKSFGESMTVEAMELLELIQGSTKIQMKDEITVEGTKIKMQ